MAQLVRINVDPAAFAMSVQAFKAVGFGWGLANVRSSGLVVRMGCTTRVLAGTTLIPFKV